MTAKKKELIELMLDSGITPSDWIYKAKYAVSDLICGEPAVSFFRGTPVYRERSAWSDLNYVTYISVKELALRSTKTIITKDQFIAAYNERNKQKEWPTESDIDVVAHNGEVEEVTINKYSKEIKPDVFVDVYDVLKAWNVTNPALQHLIKKALQPGGRGHKTLEQDINDIIASAKRAKELL